MGEASQASSTAPSVIIDLVEHHAALGDNTAKLTKVLDAAEKHLFIWVESSHQQAVAAIAFGILPGSPPQLPDCMDAAWAVTAYTDADIWQYHRRHG